MTTRDMLMIALQLTVIAALLALSLQTGAPQTLAQELEDVLGVAVTVVHMQRPTAAVDYWGTPYQRTARDGEVVICSFGPDQREGTRDDLRAAL